MKIQHCLGAQTRSLLLLVTFLFSKESFADASPVEKGRIKLDHGFNLEYRLSRVDKAHYKAHGGHIGPVFGVDGGVIPSFKLERLVLVRGSVSIGLDVSGMYNPWLESVDPRQFQLKKLGRYFFVLKGTFADAAATYYAEWRIVDDVGVRTLLISAQDAERRM